MNIEQLKTQRIIWNADNLQHENLSIVPNSILSQGYYHEFYFEQNNIFAKAPTAFLLPLIKDLPGIRDIIDRNQYIVFLGRESWLTPFCIRDIFFNSLSLNNFIFVDPKSVKARMRALDIIVSSKNVFGLITFLPKASFAYTQKLFLRSKQNQVNIFVFRDSSEMISNSAAFSKWLIQPAVSNTDFPSWHIHLEHSKGSIKEKTWLLEGVNEEEVSVHLLSELVSRSNTENYTNLRYA